MDSDDKKITQLTQVTALSDSDLFIVAVDVGTAPKTRAIKKSDAIADGGGGGGQEWSAEYATYSSFASSGGTVIPFDDTIPQVTEGSEILTLTLTPLTDTIEIETAVPISFATNDARGTVAIFKDGAANAISASMAFIANSYLVGVPIVCKKRVTVTPNVSTVISVRVGPGSGTGTMYVNGNSANRIYGGVNSAYLKVREVVAGA